MIQQSHFWAYTQSNSKQDLKETFGHQCSLQIIRSSQEVEATQMFTDG